MSTLDELHYPSDSELMDVIEHNGKPGKRRFELVTEMRVRTPYTMHKDFERTRKQPILSDGEECVWTIGSEVPRIIKVRQYDPAPLGAGACLYCGDSGICDSDLSGQGGPDIGDPCCCPLGVMRRG